MFGRSIGVFAAVAVLMLSAISLGATYGGGSGTAEDPYQIWTPEQMNTIGANSADWDKHFKLMDDIDLSAYTGTQYNIIGARPDKAFTGTFDGNRHIICNLNYSSTTPPLDVGLFGFTSKATIKNLGIENVYINIDKQSGRYYIGSLVGSNYFSTITSCFATGSVNTADISYDCNISGLVGINYEGHISDCYSTCNVAGYYHVGGLVGWNENGIISNCYSSGAIYGKDRVGGLVGADFYGAVHSCYTKGKVVGINSSPRTVGGLIGGTYYSRVIFCSSQGVVDGTENCSALGGLIGQSASTLITSCFFTGHVIGGREVGGLVGRSDYRDIITSCYVSGSVSGTNAGALVGENNTTIPIYPYLVISSCFWDVPATGRSNAIGIGPNAGGTGKTTEEMKTRSTFVDAGWDFNDIWAICEGTNYPQIKMHIPAADWVCPDGVGTEDLDYFAHRWLISECGISNEWCNRADSDESGIVDLADFSVFAEQWLQTYAVFTSPNHFVAWWQMDEMRGYYSVADSIGGHHGQVFNVAHYPWVAGKFNNALTLDGVDDYVDVNGYAGILGTSSRTCMAWIKANSTGKEQVILSWGNAINGQKWIVRLQPDGKLAAAVWGGYISGSVSVADGRWHHVAAVLADDGSPSVNEIRLYVDGFPQMVTSSNSQAINTVASQNVQMGSVYNGTVQASFFSGLLDEVRIYDVPLTGEQILRVAME